MVIAIGASTVLVGCVTPALDAQSSDVGAGAPRPTVIAFLDTGINPYHAAFATSDTAIDLLLPEIHPAPVDVALSPSPDFYEAIEEDRAIWLDGPHRTLHRFRGTQILAISFDERTSPLVMRDYLGHGTAVASIAGTVDENAVLVAVQTPPVYCTPADQSGRVFQEEVGCIVDPGLVEAMAWTADQPWIDVVSLSFGTLAGHPAPEWGAFAREVERAVSSGKLVVASNGNEAAPPVLGSPAAFPWVIGVGGVERGTAGVVALSGNSPDVVANWTASFPDHRDRFMTSSSGGTSLAAPFVAGALSRSISDVRAEWGHRLGIVDAALAVSPAGDRATPWSFRAALNASAEPWKFRPDWRPETPPSTTDPVEIGNYAARTTLPVVAPAAQTGWGYVTAEIVNAISARVLVADYRLPPEKADLAEEMTLRHNLRRAYWERQ